MLFVSMVVYSVNDVWRLVFNVWLMDSRMSWLSSCCFWVGFGVCGSCWGIWFSSCWWVLVCCLVLCVWVFVWLVCCLDRIGCFMLNRVSWFSICVGCCDWFWLFVGCLWMCGCLSVVYGVWCCWCVLILWVLGGVGLICYIGVFCWCFSMICIGSDCWVIGWCWLWVVVLCWIFVVVVVVCWLWLVWLGLLWFFLYGICCFCVIRFRLSFWDWLYWLWCWWICICVLGCVWVVFWVLFGVVCWDWLFVCCVVCVGFRNVVGVCICLWVDFLGWFCFWIVVVVFICLILCSCVVGFIRSCNVCFVGCGWFFSGWVCWRFCNLWWRC